MTERCHYLNVLSNNTCVRQPCFVFHENYVFDTFRLLIVSNIRVYDFLSFPGSEKTRVCWIKTKLY